MPKILLPLYAADTKVSDALDELSETQPAAAVFQGENLRLLTAADLAIARFKQIQVVGDVPTTVSPREDEPIRIWLENDADKSYSMQMGAYNVDIMTPFHLNQTALRTSIVSPWFGARDPGPFELKLMRSFGPAQRIRPIGLDDLVTRRFDHPVVDASLDDVVWRLVTAPPQDFYCTGTPRHDQFSGPVYEGAPCPRRPHAGPAVIVRGR
jgi:hypothetical protein